MFKRALATIVLMAFPIAMYPQVGWIPAGCSDVLQRLDLSKVKTLSQKYALFSMIKTQDDWQKAKSAGAGYADIIGASWEDFQSQKTTMESHLSFNLDTSTYESFVTSYVTDHEVDAWKDCIGLGGLTAWFDKVTADSVALIIQWKPPIDNVTVTLPRPVLTGGTVAGVGGDPSGFLSRSEDLLASGKLQDFKAKGKTTRIINITRDPTKDLRFVMAFDQRPVSLLLPAEPQPLPIPVKECTKNMNNFHVQASGEPSGGNIVYRCENMPPGRIVVADVHAMFHIDGVGPGAGWVETAWYLNDAPVVGEQWCAGSLFDGGHQCNLQGSGRPPFGMDVHVGNATIGPDGVATLRIHVNRAYDKDVHQHALVADTGTITFTLR